jgi:hypothetical protein
MPTAWGVGYDTSPQKGAAEQLWLLYRNHREISFKYDPFGRRIYKSSSSGISVYTYDGDSLIEETNSSGSAVARHSQGLNIDEPLATLRSAATSYYEADGLGSTFRPISRAAFTKCCST